MSSQNEKIKLKKCCVFILLLVSKAESSTTKKTNKKETTLVAKNASKNVSNVPERAQTRSHTAGGTLKKHLNILKTNSKKVRRNSFFFEFKRNF